jgi:DNA polymerase III subunit beta
MDFTVAKKDLLRLVARAQAVADKKSTMPVLSNVLLDATGTNEVGVRATDLYLSVSGAVPAEIRRRGSVAVPARDLLERVKAMPDGPLHVSSDSGSATVLKAAGSARRYTLHGVPGTDFPNLPQPAPTAPRIELPAEALSMLIARTQFSISPDDTRPNLNSAMFEWTEERVRMVTTDGHRLSKAEATMPVKSPPANLLLPLKAVLELRRLADEARGDGGKVTLIPSEPNAFFDVAGGLFSVKLVDAQFPSYKQVIPQQSSRTARIPRAPFAEALRAVSLAASDRTGGIKLTLSPGTLRITSESPESGDGLDEVPMDYAGGEITIGFNAKYFLDVLSAIDDEDEVILGLSGELDPATLRPGKESTERDYIAVVMPMRI